MPTPTDLFDYYLPHERIAQESVTPRDHSRLLVLDRKTRQTRHRRFFEIGEELVAGDVLVMNDTKVFKARLKGSWASPVGRARPRELGAGSLGLLEIFLLRETEPGLWSTLVRPGRKIKVGDGIKLDGLEATVVEKQDDGVVMLRISASFDEVLAFTDAYGQVPTPPYVGRAPERLEDYQTVYARAIGSVAAPTAGFHFTERLIEELKSKGVQFEFVTLHVGLGTFRPIKTETIEEHQMHSEFASVSAETVRRILEAKRAGRRIIAVGTTAARVLEGAPAFVMLTLSAAKGKHLSRDSSSPLDKFGAPQNDNEKNFAGEIVLFITPGYKFKMVDAMITNFHLPRSTLLVLVSAFAGREHVLRAYDEAVALGYRFYSFGDAMFVR